MTKEDGLVRMDSVKGVFHMGCCSWILLDFLDDNGKRRDRDEVIFKGGLQELIKRQELMMIGVSKVNI